MHTCYLMGPRILTGITIYKAQTHMKGVSITTQFRFKGPQSNHDASTQTSRSTNPKHVSLRGGRRKLSIKKSKRAEILL